MIMIMLMVTTTMTTSPTLPAPQPQPLRLLTAVVGLVSVQVLMQVPVQVSVLVPVAAAAVAAVVVVAKQTWRMSMNTEEDERSLQSKETQRCRGDGSSGTCCTDYADADAEVSAALIIASTINRRCAVHTPMPNQSMLPIPSPRLRSSDRINLMPRCMLISRHYSSKIQLKCRPTSLDDLESLQTSWQANALLLFMNPMNL